MADDLDGQSQLSGIPSAAHALFRAASAQLGDAAPEDPVAALQLASRSRQRGRSAYSSPWEEEEAGLIPLPDFPLHEGVIVSEDYGDTLWQDLYELQSIGKPLPKDPSHALSAAPADQELQRMRDPFRLWRHSQRQQVALDLARQATDPFAAWRPTPIEEEDLSFFGSPRSGPRLLAGPPLQRHPELDNVTQPAGSRTALTLAPGSSASVPPTAAPPGSRRPTPGSSAALQPSTTRLPDSPSQMPGAMPPTSRRLPGGPVPSAANLPPRQTLGPGFGAGDAAALTAAAGDAAALAALTSSRKPPSSASGVGLPARSQACLPTTGAGEPVPGRPPPSSAQPPPSTQPPLAAGAGSGPYDGGRGPYSGAASRSQLPGALRPPPTTQPPLAAGSSMRPPPATQPPMATGGCAGPSYAPPSTTQPPVTGGGGCAPYAGPGSRSQLPYDPPPGSTRPPQGTLPPAATAGGGYAGRYGTLAPPQQGCGSIAAASQYQYGNPDPRGYAPSAAQAPTTRPPPAPASVAWQAPATALPPTAASLRLPPTQVRGQ